MPNTYSRIFIQIVFAVKGRQNLIQENMRETLQKYISGIVTNEKQKLFAIYCMPDHTHIFISISSEIKLSDLVRDIKANSSRFINEQKWLKQKFQWQEGYGAFSYGFSPIDTVVNYILKQPEHHTRKTFKNEYVGFLKKFENPYQDKYLFEFLE
jgi:REP element-mobilizing transposase RayT